MKALKWLDEHFEEYILIFLSVVTVAVVFLQVFMRYALSSSLVWSEEVARYAFIWMIYIGVSYAVKKNKHLAVDAFKTLFEEKGKLIIGMIANICFLVFVVVLSYYGLDIVLRVTRESAALLLPMEWVYAAPVVGLTLTTIRLLQQLFKQGMRIKKIDSNKTGIQKEREVV